MGQNTLLLKCRLEIYNKVSKEYFPNTPEAAVLCLPKLKLEMLQYHCIIIIMIFPKF